MSLTFSTDFPKTLSSSKVFQWLKQYVVILMCVHYTRSTHKACVINTHSYVVILVCLLHRLCLLVSQRLWNCVAEKRRKFQSFNMTATSICSSLADALNVEFHPKWKHFGSGGLVYQNFKVLYKTATLKWAVCHQWPCPWLSPTFMWKLFTVYKIWAKLQRVQKRTLELLCWPSYFGLKKPEQNLSHLRRVWWETV